MCVLNFTETSLNSISIQTILLLHYTSTLLNHLWFIKFELSYSRREKFKLFCSEAKCQMTISFQQYCAFMWLVVQLLEYLIVLFGYFKTYLKMENLEMLNLMITKQRWKCFDLLKVADLYFRYSLTLRQFLCINLDKK